MKRTLCFEPLEDRNMKFAVLVDDVDEPVDVCPDLPEDLNHGSDSVCSGAGQDSIDSGAGQDSIDGGMGN